MPSGETIVPIAIPDGGVRRDLLPENVPPGSLVDAENWLYRDGRLQTRDGFRVLGSTVGQRVLAFVSYIHNDGTRRVVKGTTRSLWQYTAGAWADLGGTALTGISTDQVVFRVFDKAGTKYLLATNGADTPKKWSGAGAYAAVTGMPKCRAMMIINDHIMALNLKTASGAAVVGGSSWDFSTNIDFDAGWGATLSGIFTDTPGEIVAGIEMGALRGAVYKSDAIHLVTASGGRYPVTTELAYADISGPVSPLSVVRLSNGLHVYLAEDGSLQAFDGSAPPQSLGYHIQKYIADTLDFGSKGKSFLFWDSQRGVIHVCYQDNAATEPNRELQVSYPSGSIYPQRFGTLRMTAGANITLPSGTNIGEMAGTIGDQVKTLGQYDLDLRRSVYGDSGGQSYYNEGPNDAGANISHFFETGLSDLGAPESWKTVLEVDHLVQVSGPSDIVSGTALTVALRGADYGEAGELEALAQPLTVAPYRSGHRLTARRVGMRVSGVTPGTIQYHGATASVKQRGRR
jgi:hypothetical protein